MTVRHNDDGSDGRVGSRNGLAAGHRGDGTVKRGFDTLVAAGLVAATLACTSGAAPAQTVRYNGLCEASAAAMLDDRHFAVASDDSATIRIYERGRPDAVGQFDHAGVTDIEAAARIGDTIFWLTSHSFNSGGEDKPKRKHLFATRIGANLTLADVGSDQDGLRARIATLLGKSEKTLAKTLNIEGLAATPQGELLVGLRGPLDGGHDRALIVKIADPFALVGLPSPPGSGVSTIAAVSRLDLDGRGVRSIERVGTGIRAYLIVAGSVEDGGVPPRLFWWDGGNRVEPGPDPVLEGVTPEALIVWDDRNALVLGDNGDACSDKEGDPAARWFPAVAVKY